MIVLRSNKFGSEQDQRKDHCHARLCMRLNRLPSLRSQINVQATDARCCAPAVPVHVSDALSIGLGVGAIDIPWSISLGDDGAHGNVVVGLSDPYLPRRWAHSGDGTAGIGQHGTPLLRALSNIGVDVHSKRCEKGWRGGWGVLVREKRKCMYVLHISIGSANLHTASQLPAWQRDTC